MSKYLTKKQVIEAANKSKKAAIKCCIQHWEELRDAPVEDIEEEIFCINNKIEYEGKYTYPAAELCALCQRYHYKEDSCSNCPLHTEYDCFEEDSVYKKVYVALDEYKLFLDNESEIKYRSAAQEMVTILKQILRNIR